MSVPPLAGLEGQGCGALGGRGAAVRLLSALPQRPSTFQCPAPDAFLQPHFHQGCCSGGGHLGPSCQGCCGACSAPFSGLLQPSVRSVEDLGVLASSHRPLPSQSLCGRVSLSDGDHSVCSPLGMSGGLDGLHRSQGSVSAGASSSCFSSSSALRLQRQGLSVQSSLLWPLHGSAGLHQGHGSCFRHSAFYGDPHEALPRRLARLVILSRIPRPGFADGSPPLSRVGDCRQSSKVQPRSIPGCPISRSDHRRPIFQGFSIARTRLQASVNSRRISVLRLASRELMALAAGRTFFAGSPSSWRPFANAISPALPPPVLGSSGSPGSVSVSQECLCDLQWWLHLPRLSSGVALCQVSPDLHFWSDASDVGWGAHLDRQVASGLWDSRQAALSINARELLAVQLGLRQFQSSLQGRTVAVFCDNTTAVAYLRKEGGTRSPLLNSLAQEILRWTESLSIRLAPQFLPGSNNVLADALSRPHQLPHSEWSLNMTVFRSLRKLWPVQIDLFATSDNRRCSIYFSPFHDPMSAGTDAFLQSWDGLQAYAFPPVAIIPRVLAKLRASTGTELTLVAPYWAQRPWFSDLLQLSLAPPVVPSGPPAIASLSSSLPGSPSAQVSCLASLQRFTRAAGFSSAVAEHASLARRPSSLAVYQVRWSIYRSWCHDNGHSVSRPTLAKVADFLYWLRFTRGLSVSSLRGYRSVLSAVFRFHLPSLSSDPVIRDLLRSFRLSSAERVLRPPAWDLSKVLTYLVSPAFKPLSQASFRSLTLKTLFLLALATAKRVGELQALSSIVTFVGADACLSYIPQFVAKSESLTRSIPRSFLVKSLADFAAGLDTDLLLCPVRALRLYLLRARSLSPGRHRLFVSPRRPSRAMSKNAVSFFLREVISATEAARPQVGSLRAHEVRSVSTSVAFHRNWSVTSVLESATWASSSVFSSFYLRDIQHEYDGLLSLGPFVAAGSRIG